MHGENIATGGISSNKTLSFVLYEEQVHLPMLKNWELEQVMYIQTTDTESPGALIETDYSYIFDSAQLLQDF